jgi:hypothetical protein
VLILTASSEVVLEVPHAPHTHARTHTHTHTHTHSGDKRLLAKTFHPRAAPSMSNSTKLIFHFKQNNRSMKGLVRLD